MFVIMGANGHVGSAVAETLLGRGEEVVVVTHLEAHGDRWRQRGAEVAVADVNNVETLRAAFQRGRRAFLLNPPADTKADTDAVEHRSVAAILAALDGSGLEKVVAESTAGAQPGDRIGDLSVLWELEEGLRRQPIPAAINRAAYYMSNWDDLLEPAREGALPTMYPADLALPMVAPRDLGEAAAARLISGLDDVGVRNVEGPERYSSDDVAKAFADALGRPVATKVTPPDRWTQAYLELGFSAPAAESYARMTAVSVEQGFDKPDNAIRGKITLGAYIDHLVHARTPKPA